MDFIDDKIEMRVAGIVDSSLADTYNLVLQEVGGKRKIIMGIGLSEAQSIAVFMERVKLPRPLTHDLLNEVVKALGGCVLQVIIIEMKNGYYISNVYCRQDNKVFIFDSRTSDAVALALRSHAPIYIKEDVLNEAAGIIGNAASKSRKPKDISDYQTEQLREMLKEAIESENYERAQVIHTELDRRGES